MSFINFVDFICGSESHVRFADGEVLKFAVMQIESSNFYLSVITSWDRFKKYSFCVEDSHHSSAIKVKTAIPFNKKTGKKNKVLNGDFGICKRTKTTTVSDLTFGAKGLRNVLKIYEQEQQKQQKSIY